MSVIHGPLLVVEITLMTVVIHCVVISSVKFVAKKIGSQEFVSWEHVLLA